MQFIDRVVHKFDETSLNDLHKIKLVLPSIRPINQLKNHYLTKRQFVFFQKYNHK